MYKTTNGEAYGYNIREIRHMRKQGFGTDLTQPELNNPLEFTSYCYRKNSRGERVPYTIKRTYNDKYAPHNQGNNQPRVLAQRELKSRYVLKSSHPLHFISSLSLSFSLSSFYSFHTYIYVYYFVIIIERFLVLQ